MYRTSGLLVIKNGAGSFICEGPTPSVVGQYEQGVLTSII
jgi:hypothetical protein